MAWNGWPWSRVIILFTGLAILLIWVQVTLFHSRQNFRHWAQWLPVIANPILGVLALILAFYNATILRQTFGILAIIVAIASTGGFIQHFAGVGERVDGYRMENFLVGPPIVLPIMNLALSVLGLIAVYWRW